MQFDAAGGHTSRSFRWQVQSQLDKIAGRCVVRIERYFDEGERMALYRHGDILVTLVDDVPPDARRLRHLVLAEGELTGHSHRIAERDAAFLSESRAGLFLSVTAESATLVHQEHGPIALARGNYLVWRQREYTPREIRTVRD